MATGTPPGFTGCLDRAHGPGCAAVWRADLLRLRADQGAEALGRSAPLLGFQPPETLPEAPPEVEKPVGKYSATEPPGATPSERPRTTPSKQRYPRLLRRDRVPEAERVTQAPARLARTPRLDLAAIAPDAGYRPPKPPPLTPWRRLWPFLRLVLGTGGFSHRIDLPRLVDRLARGEAPRRLPRLPRQGWAPSAQLLVDMDLRLYPFWRDFQELVDALTGLRGRAGLEVLCLNDGPDGEAYPWGARRRETTAPYRPRRPAPRC